MPGSEDTIGEEAYSEAFRAIHNSDLLRRLWAESMREQYPSEVEPFSSCSWWLLGELVATLRLEPGGMLVDLGCGRGGPGLWLARALSAELTSVDHSAAAIELAASRAPAFVEAGRATFHVGTFGATGLPDHAADAVISVDALPFSPDTSAALREVRRILVPGGRLVFTANQHADEPSDAPDSWEQHLARAGLRFECRIPNPYSRENWRKLYALWTANADGLRDELGTPWQEGCWRRLLRWTSSRRVTRSCSSRADLPIEGYAPVVRAAVATASGRAGRRIVRLSSRSGIFVDTGLAARQHTVDVGSRPRRRLRPHATAATGTPPPATSAPRATPGGRGPPYTVPAPTGPRSRSAA